MILECFLEEEENNDDAYVSTNLMVARKIYLLYVSPMS